MSESPLIHWIEADLPHSAHWRSAAGLPPPARVVIGDDTLTANAAYRLACEGTAILWRGDFHNARQLMLAMARRTERNQGQARSSGKPDKRSDAAPAPRDAFNRQRLVQGQRARVLGMLLLPFDADHTVPLRRAPNVQQACAEAWGTTATPYVASLRDLQGAIGAFEWRKKGVEVPALQPPGTRIHPHYGVFAPIRNEYVRLLADAPLPKSLQKHPQASAVNDASASDSASISAPAFDIGTGTGVLAAVLAQRGVGRVIATDNNPRALDCARDNLQRLGLEDKVYVLDADLFPPGRAMLVVCNPPWVPAQPSSVLEQAVYDPDSRMLRGFLDGLAAHLAPGGEGWLILSDLAEHLQLRTRDELLGWIATAGLQVLGRIDIKPHHPRARDATDPLHAARAKEVTSLWRLGATNPA